MLASQFPPHVLREYAFLGDGERGALVGPHGDVAWMCAPRWDSDAVFSALIGGGGAYAVTPDLDRYVWGGYYDDGTLIWRSRWTTPEGFIECRNALAFPGVPGKAVLLRRVSAVGGPARVRVVLDPQAGFGTDGLSDLHQRQGVWQGRSGPLHLRWCGAAGARRTGGGLLLMLDLEAGQSHDLVLELSEQELAGEPPQPEEAWTATEYAWSCDVPALAATAARVDARHAYAVLRGLTSSGGGMVAAATMCLPERADAGRNYDYRYVWIRDQCYAGQAVALTETYPLLDAAVAFVAARLLEDGARMKPAYTLDGGPVPSERSLSQLVGYPGGTDKVGNWVNQQFQLDAFGESLLLFSAAAARDRLGSEHWKAVRAAVAAIEQRWTEPDAGIWEIQDEQWTHSRLTCMAGLRAISSFASGPEAGRWSALADTILADSARHCQHPSGRWQRSATDPAVDAALLLPSIRGAVRPDDPRTMATLEAVRDELARDHFVYRFRQRPGPLEDAEGAFILCGFIMALAEHAAGNHISAARYFERNRAACGTPGLFSEEYDIRQRQLRGNLPQAFVHALMLEAATQLELD